MHKRIKVFLCVLLLLFTAASFPAQAAYPSVLADLSPRSDIILVASADDGSFVFEKNIDKQTAPASLTKIMTAMLVLEACDDLRQTVTASGAAIHALDGLESASVGLLAGEVMSVQDLLYCLLLRSANEAANVLAVHVAGSTEAFVAKMNEKAQALGCTNTTFKNAHGLDEAGHVTTARDMLKILQAAMGYAEFEKISGTASYTVPATDKSAARVLRANNLMLTRSYSDYYSADITGGISGATVNSGRCVAAKASRNGYSYFAVIMQGPYMDIDNDGAKENCAFTDCKKLLGWLFENMRLMVVTDPAQVVAEVPLRLSSSADYLRLVPAEEQYALVPVGLDAGSVYIQPIADTLPEAVKAPVSAGDVIAKANVLYGGVEIATVDLVAEKDVAVNWFYYAWDLVVMFSHTLVFKLIAAVLGVALLGYIGLTIYVNLKKRKARQLKVLEYRDVNESGKKKKK